MKLSLPVIVIVCVCCASYPSYGYEVQTHERMSREAVKASVLYMKTSGVLANLGLSYAVDDGRQSFPNYAGTPRAVIDLFAEGSNFEDGFFYLDSRPVNHFYDPVYNRPLTVLGTARGQRSPDWALEDKGDIADQQYSLKDAREFLYKALTLPTKAERDKHFGLTFQTLGQVIHHLQDMAQPQHVRNDPHCDRWYCLSLYSPSRYEKYTDLNNTNLPYSGYRSVLFANPREFWATGDGRGMAEFTNANFVSAGTNSIYQILNGQPVSGAEYLQPQPSGFGDTMSIGNLLAEDGQTTVLTGSVKFVKSEVWDQVSNTSVTNPRSATYSIFNDDLKAYNKNVAYTSDDPLGSLTITYTVDELFTLNRFNFKAAYPHLIPKAVAYSAGMIDYFFRGRMEIALPDEGVYSIVDHAVVKTPDQGFNRIKLKIKNTTLLICI